MSDLREGPYYLQDVISPLAIHHGFDFGDRQGEHFGHAYNFLDYYFEDGDTQIMARKYLDFPDKVGIRGVGLDELKTGFGRKVLVFLTMRYDEMEYYDGSGYAPLPADLVSEIEAQKTAHMLTFD